MHASDSVLKDEDARVNDLMAYVVFNEVLKALQSNSSILNELSDKPR